MNVNSVRVAAAAPLPKTTGNCTGCRLTKACIRSIFPRMTTQQFEQVVVGRLRVARHVSLFRPNDRLEKLYAVRFGQFKLVCGGSASAERVVQFYLPGDLIGLDAIATGSHRFRLMALENSEVCEISFNAFNKMMGTEPDLRLGFMQSMGRELNSEYRRSALMSKASLDERFAGFLLDLGERYARLGYSDKSFRLSMTRGDIGNYLGTTVETVSRLIARFNAQGAVAIEGRTVNVLDRGFLEGLLVSGVWPLNASATPLQSPVCG